MGRIQSEREKVDFECASGHPAEAEIWVAIDWDRHPKLALEVLDDWEVTCDRCGESRPRTTPLIMVDRVRGRRVALLLTEHAWDKSEPPQWSRRIDWLKPSDRFIMVPVPMEPARRLLRRRRPSRWLTDPIGTADEATSLLEGKGGEEIAFAVRFLLEQLHGPLPLTAMALLFCRDEEEFNEYLQANPGLLSESAAILLNVAAKGAPSEQHLELADIVGPELGGPGGLGLGRCSCNAFWRAYGRAGPGTCTA